MPILGKASPPARHSLGAGGEDIHPVKYAKHNFALQNYLIG